MHNSYDKLLFFSVSKVLSLYDILSSPNFSIDEMIQEVGFLFENDPGAIKKLKTAIKVITLVAVYSYVYIIYSYILLQHHTCLYIYFSFIAIPIHCI